MSNYNTFKGEELFFKEIQNLKSRKKEFEKEIDTIATQFFGIVGVMQEGNVSEVKFKDHGFVLNGTPSYKKLCQCIELCLDNYDNNIKNNVRKVIELYKNKSFTKLQTQNIAKPTSNTDFIESNNIIENNSSLFKNLQNHDIIELDENGNVYRRSFEVDNIDLLDDFEDEELTNEGMRSSGIIDTNFDSLDTKQVVKNNRNSLPLAQIELDENGDPLIICPITGSKNVYQINSNTYASFETDEPFRVILNLADMKPV